MFVMIIPTYNKRQIYKPFYLKKGLKMWLSSCWLNLTLNKKKRGCFPKSSPKLTKEVEVPSNLMDASALGYSTFGAGGFFGDSEKARHPDENGPCFFQFEEGQFVKNNGKKSKVLLNLYEFMYLFNDFVPF